MTDPFVERDNKADKQPTQPLEKFRKTDDLAADLAEEWNAPETPGESSAS